MLLLLSQLKSRSHFEAKSEILQGGNQYWMLSKTGEIGRDDVCLDYTGRDVILFTCHGGKGNQEWEYNHDLMVLRHPSTNKCLTLAEKKDKVLMEPCQPENPNPRMKWKFQTVNEKKN